MGDKGASEDKQAPDRSASPDERETLNIARFLEELESGADWIIALIGTMARWSASEGTHRGRKHIYFIAGEAFDWPLLAQRICASAQTRIPAVEREDLLLRGALPERLADRSINDLMKEGLGVDKYRGFLNFHYGVIVEEALQHAVEEEVRKRNLSLGARYRTDEMEEALALLYGKPRADLLTAFKTETSTRLSRGMSLRQSREFTYWLFSFRVKNSDQAKIASDTKKGLDQLEGLAAQARTRVRRE